ncbi:MAG: InlB B-repeat-containing protein [Candidatus Izemoplasmatales bacterium]|nr:InlB B-repeat-containing protein [Candidatus Izemoplasmatales bacterium]
MIKKLSVIFCLFLAIFVLTACDGTSTVEFTISFNSNGGSECAPVTVSENGTFQLPTNPTKEGYEFGGWFLDNETFLQAFSGKSSVKSDVTVYAKWTEKTIDPEPEIVNPKLTVSKTEYVLKETLTAKIEFVLDKGTFSDAVVEFKSLDESIVTIDANGNLTGNKGGKTTVEVAVKDFPETKVVVSVEVYKTITITEQTTIYIGEETQLEFKIDGVLATDVVWTTLEEKIATVDANGKVSALAVGSVIIRGVSGYYTYENTIKVQTNPNLPTSLEINMIADEPLFIDSEISFNLTVLPATASPEVIWSVSKDYIATISEFGVPTFLQGGEVTFTATSTVDPTISASISVNMPNYMNPENWVDEATYDTLLQEVIYVHGMQAADDPNARGPLKLLTGSISKYFFEELVIDDTKYMLRAGSDNYPEQTATGFDFITVHSSGSYTGTGAGTANCEYTNECNGASWHFSVGSDGIFQSVPITEIAWHAGDGTGIKNKWYDTGIKATENVPGYVTFSDDGYYIVNNQKSALKASQTFNGGTIVNVTSSTRLPYTGINTKIGSNGNYYVGTIWWSTSYQSLANKGGSLNSIGIESTVNENENIMHTWSNLAKLVGELCRLKRLDPVFAVKQHNTFSGKDCPMTMRHADMWEYFMDMVYTEYDATKYLKGFTIELIENSPYIAPNGLIISYPAQDTEIEYQIRIYNSAVDYDRTFTIRTIIPAAKAVTAENARHITSTYDIIRAPYQG